MMRDSQPYTRQHYVPKFLLRQWHTPPDDMLSLHQRVRGEFVVKRATANNVGFERHLYSIMMPGGFMDTTIEREFMGPHVDDPAAKAHVILEKGVRGLEEDQHGAWAQCILSLMMRVPRMMEMLHTKANGVLGQILDHDPTVGQRPDAPNMTSREWVASNWPEAYSELAVRVLPQLIQSDLLHSGMKKGHWATRTIASSCPFDLVIGDHPLMYHGTLEKSFLIALPLSPRCVYLHFDHPKTWEDLQNLGDAEFAKRMNLESVSRAERFVFAAGGRHAAFIEKHLKAAPGLTTERGAP
ncbi:DUF4238 domain-containing protein [Variovorax sp. J22R24]|uniref:DUF4238 domain-containing protein n=1 Tax=Variovorax gracilis TaxID=3053502 RepID=UPI0025781865|nr:DUF4238 domain-containing protein [Variovorax sp. J22R24]MDM0110075.1 DUF4238 domain-containing protein [Variovorax sp. J22R24]